MNNQNAPTRSVLIVDDIEDNRILLERSLVSAGYRTITACDGAAALSEISNRVPSIVLLDWMMPGLSGLETLKAIRENYTAARLPVIMCTAVGEEDNVVEAIEAGANDYVVKPVSLPILRARMSAHLSQSDMVSNLDNEKSEAKKRMAQQMRRLMEARSEG
ncbi:response regulator [Erythrobacter alti]|uniref:response regulator n=1 Tax=Erythrobacter alti TaxID=1896145 RepID=UPI0030F37879